jgi:hypothetical protein
MAHEDIQDEATQQSSSALMSTAPLPLTLSSQQDLQSAPVSSHSTSEGNEPVPSPSNSVQSQAVISTLQTHEHAEESFGSSLPVSTTDRHSRLVRQVVYDLVSLANPSTYMDAQVTSWNMTSEHTNPRSRPAFNQEGHLQIETSNPSGVTIPMAQLHLYYKQALEQEIQAAEDEKQRVLALQALAEEEETAILEQRQRELKGLLTPPEDLPSMKKLAEKLPNEIWFEILHALLRPKVLTILLNSHESDQMTDNEGDSGELTAAPALRSIHGAFFVNRISKAEVQKTHVLAFHDLFTKPVLFNKKTDIILFHKISALHLFVTLPQAFKVARAIGVRFLAIEYYAGSKTRTSGCAVAARFPATSAVLEAMRKFGSVERLFIVVKKYGEHEVDREDVEGYTRRLAAALNEQMEKHAQIWAIYAKMGLSTKNWLNPIVEIVWEAEDLLAVVNATTTEDSEEGVDANPVAEG